MRLRTDAGKTLLVTMNVVIILTALAAAFLSVAWSESREHAAAQDRLRAFYIAESGLSLAVADLRCGRTGALGARGAPLPFNSGTYWTEVEAAGTGRWIVRSYGAYQGARQAIEAVVGEAGPDDAFYSGAGFGDVAAELRDDAVADSYSSSQGTWLSQATNDRSGRPFANRSGDVESNGDIALDPGVMVFGDAVPGAGAALEISTSFVDGSTANRAEDKQVPQVVVPPELTALAPFDVSLEERTLTRPPANRRYGTLIVGDETTLTFEGPSTVLVENLVVEKDGRLLVDARGGPVVFYVTGTMDVRGTAVVGSGDERPQDLLVFVQTDNHTGFEGRQDGDPGKPVRVREDAQFHGVLFAPNAVLRIQNRARVFGTAFGKKLRVTGNGALHYDEDLRAVPSSTVGTGLAESLGAGGGDGGTGSIRFRSWRKISFEARGT